MLDKTCKEPGRTVYLVLLPSWCSVDKSVCPLKSIPTNVLLPSWEKVPRSGG